MKGPDTACSRARDDAEPTFATRPRETFFQRRTVRSPFGAVLVLLIVLLGG